MEYARENLKTEENLRKVDEAIKNMRDSLEKALSSAKSMTIGSN